MSLNSISKLDLIWLLIFMMDRQHSVSSYFCLTRMPGPYVPNDPVHCPDFYLIQSGPSGYLYWSHGPWYLFTADVEHSDLNEMPMKSLYEAERVSNLLFTNETVFREHIIQVGKCYIQNLYRISYFVFSNFQICPRLLFIAIFLTIIANVSSLCVSVQFLHYKHCISHCPEKLELTQ